MSQHRNPLRLRRFRRGLIWMLSFSSSPDRLKSKAHPLDGVGKTLTS
jgi:hypothetical protein